MLITVLLLAPLRLRDIFSLNINASFFIHNLNFPTLSKEMLLTTK